MGNRGVDLSQVKSLAVPEGEVKEIYIGGTKIWNKPETSPYYISITRDNTQSITDFVYCKEGGSALFQAEYNLPDDVLENNSLQWSATGVPRGLQTIAYSSGNFFIYDVPSTYGTYNVTVTVSYGEYSDSKVFTFVITSDGNELTLGGAESPLVFYNSTASTYGIEASGNASSYEFIFGGDNISWLNNRTTNSKQFNLYGTKPIDTEYNEYYSVWVYARALINGYYYRSLAKGYAIRANCVMPKFKYRVIDIDATKEVYLGTGSKTIYLSSMIYYIDQSIAGDTQIKLGTGSYGTFAQETMSYSNFKGELSVSIVNQPRNITLYFGHLGTSKAYTGTATFTKSFSLYLKNAYGESSIIIYVKHKGKNAYTSGQNTTYASNTPIVTYS